MYKLFWNGIISISSALIVIFYVFKMFEGENNNTHSAIPRYIRLINFLTLLLRIINMSVLIVSALFIIGYIQTDDMLKSTFSEGIKYLFTVGLAIGLLQGLLEVVLLVLRIKRGAKHEIKYTINCSHNPENTQGTDYFTGKYDVDATEYKAEKSFYDFVCELDKSKDNGLNHLIDDIKRDSRFPKTENDYETLTNYLRCRGADLYFFNLFDILWLRYYKSMKKTNKRGYE